MPALLLLDACCARLLLEVSDALQLHITTAPANHIHFLIVCSGAALTRKRVTA
jgi:hypothetical protein